MIKKMRFIKRYKPYITEEAVINDRVRIAKEMRFYDVSTCIDLIEGDDGINYLEAFELKVDIPYVEFDGKKSVVPIKKKRFMESLGFELQELV